MLGGLSNSRAQNIPALRMLKHRRSIVGWVCPAEKIKHGEGSSRRITRLSVDIAKAKSTHEQREALGGVAIANHSLRGWLKSPAVRPAPGSGTCQAPSGLGVQREGGLSQTRDFGKSRSLRGGRRKPGGTMCAIPPLPHVFIILSPIILSSVRQVLPGCSAFRR